MADFRKSLLFLIFLGVFTANIFGQNPPQRFSIPAWVKMGMNRSEINSKLQDKLFPEMGDYWFALSTFEEDSYHFGFDTKEKLTRFRIRAKCRAASLVDALTKLYGRPSQQEGGNYIWRLNSGILSNVSALRVWYQDQNEITITYYFVNDTDGVESDIRMDTVLRGYFALNRDEYDTAIRELSNVLSKYPWHDAAFHLRGQAYMGKGDLDKALADFNQAIRLSPNRKDFHHSRGDVYSSKKNYDAAISDYNQEIRIQPDSYRTYGYRGLAYLEKKNIDLAISDFKKACDSGENFNRIYPSFAFLLGDLYRGEKKNYREAVKYFTLALTAFDPDWDNVRKVILKIDDDFALIIYNARALSYVALENYDVALFDFNKVLNVPAVKDTHLESYFGRGLILYTKKKYADAVSDFTNYLKIKTLSGEEKTTAYHYRAASYIFMENNESALTDLNQVLNSPKGSASYSGDYFLRGVILFEKKKYTDAIDDFNAYLYVDTLSKDQKITAYRYRAKAYMNLKEYYNALEDFNEIYNLDPKDKEAIEAIVVLCKELGIEP
jgi:tetratricopeptide (TPR) repeat protein